VNAQREKYCFEPQVQSWVTLWATLNKQQAEAIHEVPGVARFEKHVHTKNRWTIWLDPRFDAELVQDNIIRALEKGD